ncbi:MAG: ankyrin repeat domain-containing protein [Rickettsiaceae bacterium]|nr:ankyrin repeat domain-containing protein [Rickettsiaceae bacterium]
MAKVQTQYNEEATKELFEALKNNNLKACRDAINEGADVNMTDKKGRTPMHLAAISGNLEVTQFIYENGGRNDINKVDSEGIFPLHYASQSGNLEVTQFIYENGGRNDINKVDSYGRTPMHLASMRGDLEVTKFIYENGGSNDINNEDRLNKTPLHYASQSGNLEVTKFIYENGGSNDINKEDSSSKTPLHYATKSGNLEVTKFIYENGGSNDIDRVDAEGNTILHSTPLSNDSNSRVLAFLLENGANKFINSQNSEYSSPLHEAVNARNSAWIKTLLKSGTNPSIKNGVGETPLNFALSLENVRVATTLIECGVAITADQIRTFKNTIRGHAKFEDLEYLRNSNNEIIASIREDEFIQEAYAECSVRTARDIYDQMLRGRKYDSEIVANLPENLRKAIVKNLSEFINKGRLDIDYDKMKKTAINSHDFLGGSLKNEIINLVAKIQEDRKNVAQDLETFVDNRRPIDKNDMALDFKEKSKEEQIEIIKNGKDFLDEQNKLGANSYVMEFVDKRDDKYLRSPGLVRDIIFRMRRLADSKKPYRARNDDIRLLEFLNGSILDGSEKEGLLNNLDKMDLPIIFKTKMKELKSKIDTNFINSTGVQKVREEMLRNVKEIKDAKFEKRKELEGGQKAKIIEKAFIQHMHDKKSKRDVAGAKIELALLKRQKEEAGKIAKALQESGDKRTLQAQAALLRAAGLTLTDNSKLPPSKAREKTNGESHGKY